ncbi:hypothetical protein [Bacillus sp. JCM 19041]|uniref:hypothetical protein n=1 Tax=Bacillus sp. JCM 19041 TaxID=1460637 RepID=UPI0006D03C5F
MRKKSIYRLMNDVPTPFQTKSFFAGKHYVQMTKGNSLRPSLLQLTDESAEVCAEMILFMLDLEESS